MTMKIRTIRNRSFFLKTLPNRKINFKKFFVETTFLLQSMILVSKLMQFDSYL